MQLTLGDTIPDFDAKTTHGDIRFHDWIGDSWCVLFSHPKDFTPVCTTELGEVARLMPEFDKRGVKVIGLSVDGLMDHADWIQDIEATQNVKLTYPLIADPSLAVAKSLGLLPVDAGGEAAGRNAMDNQTARCVFVVGPDRKIKLTLTYPMSTGRNFQELLRSIDSLQLTLTHKVGTPANWNHGEDVLILPSVSDEAARESYPEGWRAPRPYMRFVTAPA